MRGKVGRGTGGGVGHTLGVENEFLPIAWFEWITSGLISGFLIITGALWARTTNQQKALQTLDDTLSDVIKEQNDRFHRDLKEALEAFTLQDHRNDELLSRIMGERVDGVKQDYQRLENELHRIENRILQELNSRRGSIENTMSEGFERVIEEWKKR